jgi:RHS repeat-associated protein
MTQTMPSFVSRAVIPLLVALTTLGLGSAALGASPTLTPQSGVTAPASIAELARALKNDVNLIYEYVYTNIEYSPTYGVKKGALGTLLDGRGNDFDHAALMVALLRQSGYTASYVYGSIRLTPSQLNNWLGVQTSDACAVLNLLVKQGGIPATFTVSGTPVVCTNPLVYADIAHVWVSVTGGSLGTTTYVYDPSFKTNTTASTGINLASAMGYSQSALLSTAGGTIGSSPPSIQGINTTNLRAALTGYANNLVSYIRTNLPTATVNDVIGGRYVQPLTQPYTPQTSLPYQTPGDKPAVWTGNIPDEYRTSLRVRIGGIDKTYFSDEIYGHRLTIVYNPSAQPVMYLDGAVQGTGTASSTTITYDVEFPFCFVTSGTGSTDCKSFGSNYTNVLTFQNVVQAVSEYSYAIVNGWDFSGRGMFDFHRRQLQANQAAGGLPSSEPVFGETLNMIGYSWLAQGSAAADLADRLIGTKFVTHCAIGVVGQVGGPYIDMPGIFVGVSSLTSDTNRAVTAFYTTGGHGSALEWGTLDQNLSKQNIGAVSTVKLLDIANSSNLVIYDAVDATSWASIKKLLTGYTNPTANDIETKYINNGYRVILPQNGSITQGAWTGVGFLTTGTSAGGLNEIGYQISSNLKGGNTTGNISPTLVTPAVGTTTPWIPPPVQVASLEPVDLSSGAYLYENEDISVGSTGFPHGLNFRRSYSSNNRYVSGPFGLGWSHAFAISATVNSDGLKGLAQDSPIDGAAAIAAAHVAQDLFSDSAKPLQKLMVATLTQRWFMDRLINNTVNVAMGSQAEQFTLLADGSYNQQLGSASRLSLSAGAYTLRYKDATQLDFNTAGNVAAWKIPVGITVTFGYDSATPPKLISVSNGLGRTLTLGYNGSNQLTSVSDGSRAISYGYDNAGNLTSYTNALGNATGYSYTPPVGTPTPGLLTKIFYPSSPLPFVTNTYDTLGRVASQANANNAPGNDTTWNYFFAGYRSEEEDPFGTQHVLYWNPRGKASFDIQDLAGLNQVTKNVYDGLDRPVLTTLPEGNSVATAYDQSVNPWANNVASITRNPKPGSGLSATTTSYKYDFRSNKPVTVTDALGRISTFAYDEKGNLVTVVTNAGAAPHFNATSRFTYTGVGLVLTANDPLGSVTQYSYDAQGNIIQVTGDYGRLNQITKLAYNALGDVISVTDPKGNVSRTAYDLARRPASITLPGTPAAPAGIVTSFTYDPDGRVLQTVRVAAGLATTSTATYTLTGKLASNTDTKGHVTRYTYDLADRLSSVRDPVGRVTSYEYDALNRRTGVFNTAIQAGALLAQSYTANGLLATLTDANGNATSFAYDGLDRPSTTTYPGGSTEVLTYDANSNVLTRKTRANQTITFTYDTLNRLSTKAPPSPAPVVTYKYDLAGRVVGVSDSSASIVAAVPPTGGTVQYAVTATYDQLNRPLGFSWTPAATATTPTGASVTFTHGYNAANQRISQGVNDNTWLQYPAGPSTTTYTTNSLNQYTAVGAVTPTYDANGNLTYDGALTYCYDAEDRLTSALLSGTCAAPGTTVANYSYDAQGRRKSKTVASASTIYVTDTDNREVLEYNGSTGQIQAWYAYGPGSNEVLNRMDVPAGTRQTLVPDIQGSLVATMESATGALTKRVYLPYGESTSTAGSFAYTGLRIDPETNGRYYARARIYSPMLGRFVQPDPIGHVDDANLYTYVRNDPLNLVDLNGLAATGRSLLRQFITETADETVEFYAQQQSSGNCGIACTVGGTIASTITEDNLNRTILGLTVATGIALVPRVIAIREAAAEAAAAQAASRLASAPAQEVLGYYINLMNTGYGNMIQVINNNLLRRGGAQGMAQIQAINKLISQAVANPNISPALRQTLLSLQSLM